ncbi:MAG: M20 family metallopeptidase [Gammaproteobacteria bacterium]|nr:M20 family metallopeptidase [Gammaproteobacteria bacterium]
MPIIDEIERYHDELTQWRHDIHAHPELGFEENRTADFVAQKLEEFGIEVFRGIGKTGVVGVLRVGNETTAVGLRADMDALPILEANSFDHVSREAGKMHACGHDGHTTMLLGAARYLARTRNFRGQVNFIFQPAEEGIGGARAMIEDGLFQQFPCDSIFAMHNAPSMPLGRFGVRAGLVAAAGAFFDIDVSGTGAHGAHPNNSVDPIIVASQLVGALQTIVSRNIRPMDTAVVSVTQIHAGDAYNVIPGSARLSGTVRTFSTDIMEHVHERMNEISAHVASAFGATADVDFRTVFHPVVNDEHEAEFAAEVCEEVVGSENVMRNLGPGTGSEDFSFMLEQVPGCYLHIGNGASSPVHNPGYDFNDSAIPLGSSFFARIVEKRLAP